MGGRDVHHVVEGLQVIHPQSVVVDRNGSHRKPGSLQSHPGLDITGILECHCPNMLLEQRAEHLECRRNSGKDHDVICTAHDTAISTEMIGDERLQLLHTTTAWQ
jgi:hypothetical protein